MVLAPSPVPAERIISSATFPQCRFVGVRSVGGGWQSCQPRGLHRV